MSQNVEDHLRRIRLRTSSALDQRILRDASSAVAGGSAGDASEEAGERGLALCGRPRESAFGWMGRRAPLPWAVAAVLAVACGVLLYQSLTSSPRQAAPQAKPTVVATDDTEPLTRGRIAEYVEARRKLGSSTLAVVWGDDDTQFDGNLATVADSRRPSVVVRVRVIRHSGEVREYWKHDAIVQTGHVVDLVTSQKPSWPASLKLSADGSAGSTVAVSIQARLTNDPPTEINSGHVLLKAGTPTSIGSVTTNGYRYEIQVEAVLVDDADVAI